VYNPFDTSKASVMLATIIIMVTAFAVFTWLAAQYPWMFFLIPLAAAIRVGYYIFRGK
jgi:hypothetical protein